MTDRENLKMLIEAIDYSFWNPIEKEYDKELTWPVIDKVKYIKRVMQEDPCDGCTNRKGCVTCENGELRETMQEEPVSDELEKVVEEIVDPTVLNAYGVKEIANRLRRTMIDSVNEDLEEEIEKYFNGWFDDDEYNEAVKPDYTAASVEDCKDIARHFAEWQKAKLMANATEVKVHIEAGNYPYIPQIELYDYDKDVPLAKEGDKYKVVLIKEE